MHEPKLPPACRIIALAFITLVSGVPAARADLTWKQNTVELNADAKTTTLEARFPFTNAGKTAVDIRDIQTSCGCTTVELKQRHYAPGEGGEIVAVYTIGDHVGLQSKTVLVTCNDETETALTLTAHLPELLRVQPASVTWKPGEAITTKTIQITASPDTVTFDGVTLQPSNTSMTAVLRTVAEGKKYEIQVTPLTTERPATVALLVRTRLGKRENLFRAYATVEIAPPARGPAPLPPMPSAAPSPIPAGG